MKIIGGDIKFESTGRETYANNGIIGLSPKGEIFGGYDQTLDIISEYGLSADLTPEERAELSDFMVEQWKKFKQPK